MGGRRPPPTTSLDGWDEPADVYVVITVRLEKPSFTVRFPSALIFAVNTSVGSRLHAGTGTGTVLCRPENAIGGWMFGGSHVAQSRQLILTFLERVGLQLTLYLWFSLHAHTGDLIYTWWKYSESHEVNHNVHRPMFLSFKYPFATYCPLKQ